MKRKEDVAFKNILKMLGDNVELCVSENGTRLDIAKILGQASEKTHI
jgi:hypothetical protein